MWYTFIKFHLVIEDDVQVFSKRGSTSSQRGEEQEDVQRRPDLGQKPELQIPCNLIAETFETST